jgi:fatty acid desaturase
MHNPEQFLLDDFVSPKIIAGPHASHASRAAALALRHDPHYLDLTRRLKAAGVFSGSRWGFGWRIVVFATAYIAGFAYLLTGPGLVGCLIACGVIGFAHLHGNFIAHDAGHGAITRNEVIVQVIGQFFDTFLGGYSFTYFRRAHDLHHYHCNEIDRDPNTMTRMFRFTAQGYAHEAGPTRLTTRWTTRWQHILIPALYPMWSFALRAEGIAYVARNRRKARLDAVLLIAHFALWFSLPVFALGWWGAVACYVGVTAVTSIYLAVIVPINHIGMPTLDASTPTSFITQQVTTTRNLVSSPLRDFLFIGQNSQIEHHLFPWAPTFNLGRGRAIVRELCREHGLPYRECSYDEALREVHQHYLRMATYHPDSEPVDRVTVEHCDDLRRAS